MTAVFDDPALPSRSEPLAVDTAARAPQSAEVIGVAVAQGARSVRVPGGESIEAAQLARRGFEGKVGQVLSLSGADSAPVVMAVGLGAEGPVPLTERFRLAAAALVKAAGRSEAVALITGTLAPELAPAAVQAVAEGAALAAYRYQGFRSSPGPTRPRRLTVVTPRAKELLGAAQRGRALASAVALVRDLVNEPPGSLTPSRFADIATRLAEGRGLEVTVYDGRAIEAERLGGLAGVARGSREDPRLVRLEYTPPGGASRGNGAAASAGPTNGSGRTRGRRPVTVALVGKGITFDSGGLSLKSGEGMMNMKDDMAGAAVVLGTMSLLAELELPARVLGFLPLTENMPGGRAIKPGDVLRARNGKTIEVLNTDAEGRLVLADGLSLAAEEEPDAIVDLATLTGAVVVALGKHIAGLMGNDEALLARVEAAAERSGERVWRLPLPADYRRDLDSEVADMKNIGRAGQAGSVIAGLFLEEFVAGRPWAHLDIAGTAFGDTESGYTSRGATGYGVRTLIELLESYA